MGRGECGRTQDEMRASVGYRTQGCYQRDKRSCESLGEEGEEEEEKVSPSVLVSASQSQDIRATDEPALGRDGQVQSQSALKILQQQLESFQALRQQTLQNVSLVQSEINEILHKNISDMKSSEFNPDNSVLTSTAISIAMPRGHQEASHFKKPLHRDNSSATSHCPETNFNTVFGKTIQAENIPHQILLKYKTIGKSENHTPTSRNKAALSLNSEDVLKNYANNICSTSFVGLETEEMTPLREIKTYVEPKVSMAFRKYDDEDDGCLTECVSSSFKDIKEESRKTPRHELSYTFERQNSPNVVCGKDNDSGYLSEQDLTEKAMDTSNEDFKSRKTSELEDSESHSSMVPSKENNQTAAQIAVENKYLNKELLMKGCTRDKLQSNFLSNEIKDRFLFPNHTEERHIDRKELRQPEVLEFCDVNAGSDDYAKKVRLLQLSIRESEHVQKKVMNLEHENVDLRNQMKPLTDIIQSLTEQNSKYQKQIKDLHDEKNNIQERLVKSEGDCKQCLKEVKRILKKCKELQQQKATLEEKQDQLYAQNQHLVHEINDFRKKDQKAQESLASFTKGEVDLIVAFESLKKQLVMFQKENKTLGEKICQLTDKKSFLEKEAGEKQEEIKQLKENEKTAISELQSLVKVMQSLKVEKLNLDKILQEAISAEEVLQKELLEAQSGRSNAEEKLLNECKNAKKEIGVLESNLSNMEKECERLRTVVTDMTDANWMLKKELHEYKQEASDHKNKIRKLSEALLLMENKMRSTENERDVFQFEAHRLRRNNVNLRDQVTTLVREQYKQRYSSGSQEQNDQPAEPPKVCEEISSYHHISLIHDPPECEKIAEIRRKLEEEELCTGKRHNSIKKFYRAFSFSCTTSVIKKSGFSTAVQKKCSSLCSAT